MARPSECPLFRAGPEYCCGACHMAKREGFGQERIEIDGESIGAYDPPPEPTIGFGHWRSVIGPSWRVRYEKQFLDYYNSSKIKASLEATEQVLVATRIKNCALLPEF